jgi:hypothetical protein
MNFRRLGPSPKQLNLSGGGHSCPDILELDDGDIAVIGRDITALAITSLPGDAGCDIGERIVRIPRRTLLAAIPGLNPAV